jgi:hypothetical protein
MSVWLVKGRLEECDGIGNPMFWVAPVIVSAKDLDAAVQAYRWWVGAQEDMILCEVLSVKWLKAEAVVDSFGKAV